MEKASTPTPPTSQPSRAASQQQPSPPVQPHTAVQPPATNIVLQPKSLLGSFSLNNKLTWILIAIIILVLLIIAVFAYRQRQQQIQLMKLKRKLRRLT